MHAIRSVLVLIIIIIISVNFLGAITLANCVINSLSLPANL